jgi:dTDP-4-amino-4,6-dideoxygalactose transaminase
MDAAEVASPQIPLFDLRLEPEDLEAVAAVLRAGHLESAGEVERFEEVFAEHLGSRHAVALSSCTAALHLAYLAAGIGPGDEVIVPSITFAATANAVLYCGATPVFADIVGPHDLGIDPEDVARAITTRTKAVVAVHYGGYAAGLDRLTELCDEHGLALIEDAAHAPSATWNGRKLGTVGLAGAFSFFSNKVLSVGEGGLLATDSDEVAELARRLRAPSSAPIAEGPARHGFDYRLDEPRAALLRSRITRLEADISQRRRIVHRYRAALAGRDDVVLPFRDEDVDQSSCYVMPLVLRDGDRRPEIRRVLRERHNVQTSVLYPAIHEFTAYRERFPGISLPRSEHIARAEVTVPLYPHMSDAQIDRVVAALDDALTA